MIQIKRVYDLPVEEDGARFLVVRLWPRGMKKEALQIDAWCKSLAPSNELRRWFSHDPIKRKEFQRRYWAELDENNAGLEPLFNAAPARQHYAPIQRSRHGTQQYPRAQVVFGKATGRLTD
jgi:uncharacterized protein YeaO (DUF488 family)